MGRQQVDVLLDEVYAQKNLMHAQIMASTELAKSFGKQICDFRREVRAELDRSHEQHDRSQNEQSDAECKKY